MVQTMPLFDRGAEIFRSPAKARKLRGIDFNGHAPILFRKSQRLL